MRVFAVSFNTIFEIYHLYQTQQTSSQDPPSQIRGLKTKDEDKSTVFSKITYDTFLIRLQTICCLFFPPMIVKLGFRSKTDIREMPQTEEQHEEYEREDREELDGNYVDQDNKDTGTIEASTSFDEV